MDKTEKSSEMLGNFLVDFFPILYPKVKNYFGLSIRHPLATTGTPPLTRFFGSGKNCVKRKQHYRRSILVLKPKNGEYESSKSTFS